VEWRRLWYGRRISMGFITIILLVIVGVVVWIMLANVRKSKTGGASQENESALELLKKRYVRGEISQQEFEEKNAIYRNERPCTGPHHSLRRLHIRWNLTWVITAPVALSMLAPVHTGGEGHEHAFEVFEKCFCQQPH